MLIRSKRRHPDPVLTAPTLSLASNTIPLVSSTSHLGVRLSNSLTWSDHISASLQRLNFKIFMLKRLARRTGASDVAKRLYLGLVRPSLEYAGPVWDACSHRDAMAAERLQLAVARCILRCSRRDVHNVDVLTRINWPTLAWRRRRFKLLLLWDLLHNRGPPSLQAQVPQTASSRMSYSLRNKMSIAFPVCQSSRRLNGFLPSSIALFNSLPSSLSSSSTRSSFLRSLDCHFLHDKFSFGLS